MLPFIFSNLLIATNIFIATPPSCGTVSNEYIDSVIHGQTLIATGIMPDATRGPGIYTPNFIWPVDHSKRGEGFGVWRPDTNSMHMGMDIFPGEGSEIHAASNGIVTKVEYGTGSYGFMVEIYDGYEYSTLYAHMIAGSFEHYGISVGTQVIQGQVIGLVGSTGRSSGPHLHFEIHDGDTQVDPEPIMAKYASN
jgi:murein DD-endopeptidase MepM/ murein hydrolase activator NlpD